MCHFPYRMETGAGVGAGGEVYPFF